MTRRCGRTLRCSCQRNSCSAGRRELGGCEGASLRASSVLGREKDVSRNGAGLAVVQHALANLVYSLEWEFPPGQDSMDMSDEFGLIRHRRHPLLVLPPRSRLPSSAYMCEGSD